MGYIVDYECAGQIEVEEFGPDYNAARIAANKISKVVGAAYVIRYSGSVEGGDYKQHGQAVHYDGQFSHFDGDFMEPKES